MTTVEGQREGAAASAVETSRPEPPPADPGTEPTPTGPGTDPPADPGPELAGTDASAPGRRPLYPRLLRLRHITPNAWQRALLGEGALACAVLLVLADLATAWTLLVLPLAVAAVVKAHDLLAGALGSAGAATGAVDVHEPASVTGPDTQNGADPGEESAPRRRGGSGLRRP